MDGETMSNDERGSKLKRKALDLLRGDDQDASFGDAERGYTDEERAAIIEEAYANLEASDADREADSLDPNRPDALAEWNKLRPKPQSPPRPRGRDKQERWNALFDQRWRERMVDFLAPEDNYVNDAAGIALALARREMRQHVRTTSATCAARSRR
jgi:hypothetical protein